MGIWVLILLGATAVVLGVMWLFVRNRGLDREGRRELRRVRRLARTDDELPENPSSQFGPDLW
jgi:hypothetical protein